MKRNFDAVYEVGGKNIKIKTPTYLALILNLQEALLEKEDFNLSEEQENVFNKSHDFLEEEVSKIFTDFTGIEVGEVIFKQPKKKDDHGLRVEIIPQEEEEESIGEGMVEIDQTDSSVTVTSDKRSIRVLKREDGSHIIHIKSLTENVGKGSAVHHYLSEGEEVKNTIVGMSDDALKELTIALVMQSNKDINN